MKVVIILSKFKSYEKKLGSNRLSITTNDKEIFISPEEISDSWKDNYIEKVSREKEEIGLRVPQFGALSAIRAHWTTSSTSATIVLPTGTGKSETIFSTIVSERITSSLIVVPSNYLREQLYEGAKKFGILPELEMISKKALLPTTLMYKSKPKKEDEDLLLEYILMSNIIVTTPRMLSSMSPKILKQLVQKVDVVFFDEAHHLAAKEWSLVREMFTENKILQFTATPFRNDGKKIDGKIIFNYDLSLAQNAGYFMPIDFYPIKEFDEQKSDLEIAKISIKLLEKDIDEGFNHILLARANTQKRADELFKEIYSTFTHLNPVVIHSNIPAAERKEKMQSIKNGKSKIVVCVDMFGEGIDIPTLKIAAIHDKYKSLPITLQFIGRFARSGKKKLGNAKLVTNIAIDDLKESVEELYHQNSDWNQLLNIHSSNAISKEIETDEFYSSFKKGHVKDIDLSQIKLKISTRIFRNFSAEIDINRWEDVLDKTRTTNLINEQDNVFIFIEEIESRVHWSDQKNIFQYGYDFFVVFYDKEKKLIHIHETDVSKGNKLIEKIFKETSAIKGDVIYRSLSDINRLMIGTLGLKQQPSGRISFRMFTGSDIKSGINESISAGSIKSNLFGYGYQNGNRISIGCSYKGKVWMRWVESIGFWKEWCKLIGSKILDDSISTTEIFENSLVSEPINKFPEGTPYKILLPESIETSNSLSKQFYIEKENKHYPFFNAELKNPKIIKEKLHFELWINERKYVFAQSIEKNSFSFSQIEGDELFILISRTKKISATEYLFNNAPEISFIQNNGLVVVVQENLSITVNPKKNIELNPNKLIPINWIQLGVDIKSESQGINKKTDSIQYATIHNIVDQSSDVIFDDDGSGEIADVVSIQINQKMKDITFNLYHCKYSDGVKPGARVKDLYEVCGQAEKSIIWNDNIIELIDRMIYRENARRKSHLSSRFEKGDLNILNTLKKMIRSGYVTRLNISIVQPGVSRSKLTDSMKQVIISTDSHLIDTYGIQFNCYFSN